LTFRIPEPDLQIEFAAALADARGRYLQTALSKTVRTLPITQIDSELAQVVSGKSLAVLASHGMRGELVFPVPLVLSANPMLLGYYRLLYGYSQKEFYGTRTGAGRFKSMEEKGIISPLLSTHLSDLCQAMCGAGSLLLAGIGATKLRVSLLDDLTLLTLGPQFRGGANVKRGVAGIRTVFNLIQEIVQSSIVSSSETMIEVAAAAGRHVFIEFAPDPDIVLRERMTSGNLRKVVAIEVKAGQDFSNIHNRIGEAEKSHQKAKLDGFSEFWTVVNVEKFDLATARRESPTTNRFYRIADLARGEGPDYQDFRERIISHTGIRDAP